MEVRNCKNCGRLYNYIGGAYRLCPDCMKKLEEKFQEVKQYIEDNPRSDMRDISENCDVSTRQIEQWIREERLSFSDDSPIGIACEVCGATIKTGRYCERCKYDMANRLGSMYGSAASAVGNVDKERARREKARMRFLDK